MLVQHLLIAGNISIHQFLFTKGVNNDLPWTRDYMYK